jgi:uncharacterized membrane protein
MESPENYNFSIFRPRNLHGRKNRNVILSMLFIWAVAVFGFQILLRVIEKPVSEEALISFEKLWPVVKSGQPSSGEAKSFLNTLLLARGKGTLHPDEQEILADAISCITNQILPADHRSKLAEMLSEIVALRADLQTQKARDYLDTKKKIRDISLTVIEMTAPFTGIGTGTLEASILSYSLNNDFPASLDDKAFERLPGIMKLYMTHNRSVLTDTKFLGFPFHYFYTAVFLLIMFIVLCIVYNILIEWRLKKQGIIE